MEQAWTPADQGLLSGMQLIQYLKANNWFPPNAINSPLPIQVGEETIAVTSAQGFKWTRTRVRPESWSRFRLIVKWKRDPIMAPFLWLILLPFNLVFALIGREMATKTHEQWIPIGSGPLVITNRALLQAVPGGLIRISWDKVTDVMLDGSLSAFRVTYEGQFFHFTTSHEWCPWLYVASRFLAFRERAPGLPIPNNFLERAKFHRQEP